MKNKPKLTGYAKLLIAKKFCPRQQQIQRGYTRNPNAAVYKIVRGE